MIGRELSHYRITGARGTSNRPGAGARTPPSFESRPALRTDMTATRACKPASFVVTVLELTGCLTLAFAGCTSHTVPDHRGVAPNGAPVPGYHGQTVRVVTGGLVETIELHEDRPLNLQVNVEDLRPDTFQVDGVTHYVRWTMMSWDPDPGKAVFEVSIGRGRTAAP
jgi:hypothetical protein